MSRFKTYFQASWVNDPEYKDWVQRVPDDENSAQCKLCRKTFTLSTMGTGALKSHMSSKKHLNAVSQSSRGSADKGQMQLTSFCFKSPQTAKSDDPKSDGTGIQAPQSQTLELLEPENSALGVSAALPENDGSSAAQQQPQSLNDKELKLAVTKAEILWTLKAVSSHYSMNSCKDIVSILKVCVYNVIIMFVCL